MEVAARRGMPITFSREKIERQVASHAHFFTSG
jgi:hypothetical protein